MKTRSSSSCRTVMTPYGRIVKSISQNDHWRRELTLGRRIGFYRIRGDVGSGNFSQVKVATHSLTGGKLESQFNPTPCPPFSDSSSFYLLVPNSIFFHRHENSSIEVSA